jgi:hypothetical protein
MAELRDLDPELWNDVGNAYAGLARSKRDGGYPPSAESL